MFSEKNVVTVLGGPSVLGRQINNTLEMDQIIRDGFPYKAGNHVRSLLSLKLPVFAEIIEVSERTLARVRKSRDARFSSGASDRLYRLARIYCIARDVLEDEASAREWLGKPQAGLGGKTPLDLMRTEAGAREVEDLLWRIEYGVIA